MVTYLVRHDPGDVPSLIPRVCQHVNVRPDPELDGVLVGVCVVLQQWVGPDVVVDNEEGPVDGIPAVGSGVGQPQNLLPGERFGPIAGHDAVGLESLAALQHDAGTVGVLGVLDHAVAKDEFDADLLAVLDDDVPHGASMPGELVSGMLGLVEPGVFVKRLARPLLHLELFGVADADVLHELVGHFAVVPAADDAPGVGEKVDNVAVLVGVQVLFHQGGLHAADTALNRRCHAGEASANDEHRRLLVVAVGRGAIGDAN